MWKTHTTWYSEAEVNELADEHKDEQHPATSTNQQPMATHYWHMDRQKKKSYNKNIFELWKWVTIYYYYLLLNALKIINVINTISVFLISETAMLMYFSPRPLI